MSCYEIIRRGDRGMMNEAAKTMATYILGCQPEIYQVKTAHKRGKRIISEVEPDNLNPGLFGIAMSRLRLAVQRKGEVLGEEHLSLLVIRASRFVYDYAELIGLELPLKAPARFRDLPDGLKAQITDLFDLDSLFGECRD